MDDDRVLVASYVPIPAANVTSLLETIQRIFKTGNRVTRLIYERGAALRVEQLMPVTDAVPGGEYQTPYKAVRSLAQISISERIATPLEDVCSAVQSLSEQRTTLTFFVTNNKERLRRWTKKSVRLEEIFRVPLHEDPDCPEGRLFVCGSTSGITLLDVENVIVLELE